MSDDVVELLSADMPHTLHSMLDQGKVIQRNDPSKPHAAPRYIAIQAARRAPIRPLDPPAATSLITPLPAQRPPTIATA